MLEVLYKKYEDPSKHPIRILARVAFSTRTGLRTLHKLQQDLMNEGATEQDIQFACSIFSGVIKAKLIRMLDDDEIIRTSKKWVRTDWLEEIDVN